MSRSFSIEPLQVEGRFLESRETRKPMILRGVNCSGMEYRPTGCGGLTEAGIASLIQEYGCRILRVPFQQQWALERPDYLEQLRTVASWVNGYGAYILFDLQWIDERSRGGANRVPPLPNPASVDLWRLLVGSFRENPGVLFDLFNEPHDRLPGDPFPLLRPDGSEFPEQVRVLPAMWQEWALHLIDAVREVHPASVLFVSGLDWGYDLRPFPLDRPNLVYSTHVYRARGTRWREAFGQLAETCCVFAGEWGGEAADLAWGTRLADYFDDLQMGWTAWSCADHPRLFTSLGPTPFGRIVLDRLSG
jgi:hypothetical protein